MIMSDPLCDAGSSTLPRINPNRDIRVLRLLPAQLSEPLECQIEVQTLQFPGELSLQDGNSANSPEASLSIAGSRNYAPYQALSYSWGSWEDSRTLTINGNIISITKNLWKALRRLRQTDSIRTLWVDQLCIDQANIPERNAQVQLMGAVYRQAETVLIWLGDWEDGSHEQELQYYYSDDHEWSEQKRLGEFSNELMLCFTHFADQETQPSWSERGWVVQEAILAAQDPIVCIHDLEIPAEQFVTYAPEVPIFEKIRTLLNCRDLPDEQRTLFHLSRLMSNTNVTDPRDKIYSMLGIMSAAESRLITPDYSSDLVQVYQQATYASIAANQSLAILSLISSSDEEETQYPSWVVDFDKYFSNLPKSSAVNIHFGPVPGSGSDATSDGGTAASASELETEDEPSVDDESDADVEYTDDHDSAENDESMEGEEEEEEEADDDLAMDDESSANGEGLMFEMLRILDFALTPFHAPNRSWYPNYDSKTPFATLDAAAGTLQVHGFKFDTISHTVPLTELETLFSNIPDTSLPPTKDSTTIGSSLANQTLFSPSLYQPTTGVPTSFTFWLTSYFNPDPENDPQTNLTDPLTWIEYHIATSRYLPDIFITQQGFIGLCGPQTHIGDTIVLLYGAPAPAILRERKDGTWSFGGWGYVHGIMDDELAAIVGDRRFAEETFVLR